MAEDLDPSVTIIESSLLSKFFNQKDQQQTPSLELPQPLVTVHLMWLGVEPRTYLIHKNIICKYSPFFEAAFNSNFKEGETQRMELWEKSGDTFGIFVNWLYKQKIVDENGWVTSAETLIDLWLLAQRFLVPQLQNQALTLLENIRGLKKENNRRLPPSMLKRIYNNTSEDSVLRKYVIATWHDGVIEEKDGYLHPRLFLLDIVNSINSKMRLAELQWNQQYRSTHPQKEPVGLSVDELKKFYVDETTVRAENPNRRKDNADR
ncbi:hypothetical protein HYFRA_00005617 [Hymenoscyphus fraxineus]|uniref:BTB domain-containing protein n=1 Tax=Hymenoscyphus fraxineus TaxID=746836 RepID=A0A9N9KRS8_9HELO|nr:hypothetical protein HYFRA_00005617 [Hymenoscyphus fraxineus]